MAGHRQVTADRLRERLLGGGHAPACALELHSKRRQLALKGAIILIKVTMACASAERPSPTGPTFSLVLNLTDIRSTATPTVSARRSRIDGPVVFQLRALQNDGRVDIRDAIAFRTRQFTRVTEKLKAVRTFPSRIGVGEVHPDVPQCSRAQDCIGDGVRKNVGVRMAFQANLPIESDTPEDQRPTGGDPMIVPPESGTNIHVRMPCVPDLQRCGTGAQTPYRWGG